jgi:NADP-dependent 3-hydroxy acid dehydrogenase YdfG
MSVDVSGRTAVVTGASSGIGAASARLLASAGYKVVLGARRLDRLEEAAAEIRQAGGEAVARALDVTAARSVEDFCAAVAECHVLVNNAGGALGLETIADAVEEKWLGMYESNVLGVMRMTRALLPRLIESGDGLVVNIGSVAAFEPYPGGGGYNAAKHASRAVSDVLRLEMLGKPIRVCQLDPGMVETEFSLVRFDGDEERAAAVYKGITPLLAEDVAECVVFAATRPSHVDIDHIVVRCRDQARVYHVNRRA